MGMGNLLKEFLIDPFTTGAIAPSSDLLGKEMVNGLALASSGAVLEYGSGAGALTPFVLEGISPACRFLAIEVNPRFAQDFRGKFPKVELHNGSVAEARKICDEHNIQMADCIISGLPWAAFAEDMQKLFLDEMMRVLKPGGQFATFIYVPALFPPAGKRFVNTLPKYFEDVSRSSIVWGNLPPAIVLRCRR